MSDFETVPVGTMKELEKIKEENAALVAHMLDIGEYMKDQWPGAYSKVFEKFYDLAPETSLARLIAEKQAEALDKCAEGVAACNPKATPRGISIAIRMEAEQIRRQAEEEL